MPNEAVITYYLLFSHGLENRLGNLQGMQCIVSTLGILLECMGNSSNNLF